jgi:glutaminyl-tRNA synthetase
MLRYAQLISKKQAIQPLFGLDHDLKASKIISGGQYYHFCSASETSTNNNNNNKKSHMPPEMIAKYEYMFRNIGLEERVVKNTIANKKVSNTLATILEKANVEKCEKKLGHLLYGIATKLGPTLEDNQDVLLKYVMNNKIENAQQLERAVKFLKESKTTCRTEFDLKHFEKYCGIGVNMSEEDISCRTREFLQGKVSTMKSFAINLTTHLRELREIIPCCNNATVMKVFKQEVEKLQKIDPSITISNEPTKTPENHVSQKIFKFEARDLTSSLNPPEIYDAHMIRTKGQIVTRFPPEPNGYLHLGHAKAIRFNFSSAFENNGACYLRYDDTNPEKESADFIKSIEENVSWLGYTPTTVTHASDYIEVMYAYGEKLIKAGKAYACAQPQEEMQEYRKEGKASPYRNRSVEENLKIFEEMKESKFSEGQCCIRLKIDHKHANPTMRDPVAFRVKYKAHPHTGTKWVVYPTYDFAHCICDSLEDITHSLCTLEFEIRRDLYYWILNALNIYRPKVWEYSRLNITHNVLSKRKLAKLISEKVVEGWDDPRLLTLKGLRRRGYTPEALNDFCDTVSVTRRGNENMVSIKLLQNSIRKHLDKIAVRTMAVLDPVTVTITNLNEKDTLNLECYPFPKEPQRANPYTITLSKKIFIERADVKLNDVEGFYGLAPNKVVGLRYATRSLKCHKIVTDKKGEIQEVIGELVEGMSNTQCIENDSMPAKKARGCLHWISEKDSLDAEVRIFRKLFLRENPNEEENFLDCVNPDSKQIVKNCKINKNVPDIAVEGKYQFERVGYFCVDQDSDIVNKKYVFNKTIGLVDKDKIKALTKNSAKK